MKDRITPSHITELAKNEVFVFGSNVRGEHRGGAARQAHKYFGAQWGQGEGLQGQSYAIPTMDGAIGRYVQNFIAFAREHDEQFLVTEIGCGIAGYTPDIVAPFFLDAMNDENISLPKSFWDVLHRLKQRYRTGDPFVECLDTVNRILGKHYNNEDNVLNQKGLFESGSHEAHSFKYDDATKIFSHFIIEGYSLWLCALRYIDQRCGLADHMRICNVRGSIFGDFLKINCAVIKDIDAVLKGIDNMADTHFEEDLKWLLNCEMPSAKTDFESLRKVCDIFTKAVLVIARTRVPVYNSYYVSDRFYAGEYPRCKDEAESKNRIKALLDFGITDFIDLTVDGELTHHGGLLPGLLPPYAQWLPKGVGHYRFPIADNHAPAAGTHDAVNKINELLDAGRTVYLHCRGGVGRTSTIVMQWIIESTDILIMDDISIVFNKRWRYFPKAKTRKPFNKRQLQFVMQALDNEMLKFIPFSRASAKYFMEAIRSYHRWFEMLEPWNAKAYNNLAINYTKIDYMYMEAFELFYEALGLCGNDKKLKAEILFNMSNCYAQYGNYKNAIELLEKAVELDPDEPRYKQSLKMAWKISERELAMKDYQALNIFTTDNHNEALRILDKVIEYAPEYADAYCDRAFLKAYFLEGYDDEEILADFNKAIELEPDNARFYCERANWHDDDDAALADFAKSIEINPQDFCAYNNRGIRRDLMGDHLGAIDDFNKAIDLEGVTGMLLFLRGKARYALHDIEAAEADFAKALELEPELENEIKRWKREEAPK